MPLLWHKLRLVISASLAATATILFCDGATAVERHGLATALDTITTGELQHHVDILADDAMEGREGGSRGGRAAGDYLAEQLRSFGLLPAGTGGHYEQPFGAGYRNILGRLEGSDRQRKQQFVILGAHYDHVGYGNRHNSRGPIGFIHNGADDNASGTAALLEVAQACEQLPRPPRRSIVFALWDGEEKGMLGSRHWIEHPTLRLDHLVLAINMDMVGHLRDQRLQVFGTRTSAGLRQLVSRQNEGLALTLRFPWKTLENSDHYSFFGRRIPYLMFHTGLHDDYHRPSDDADTLSAEGMRKVARLVSRVLLELADGPDLSGFRHASRGEDASSRRRFERLLPAPPPRLGIRWQPGGDGPRGLIVASVTAGSAADRSGLAAGDRLIRLNGHEITDPQAFRRDVLQAENSISVAVERSGESAPVGLTVQLSGVPMQLGIAWRENRAEPASVYLTRVVPGLPAYEAGLRPGDRIYELAGQRFAGSDQFQHLVTTLPRPLEVMVERRGKLRWVTIEP